MAFTQIRPINLGGGEIGTGIAMGLQEAGNSLFQLLEQKKQRQYEREQTLLRIAEKGLTPMDAMYNSNSLISNKIKSSFIDFIKQKVVDKKGIDNDTVMQVLTAKNLLNSTINKIKQTEEYIAKQTDLITKNPDKYQRDKYDESLNQYLTKISKGDIVTMEELPRFIWPKEKHPKSWSSSQIIVKGKPTQTDVPIDSQKIKRISTWTDDNTRIGKWTEGYGSDEGLQLGTKELFYNGNNSVDPDAPTEEERKEYIKKATEIQNDPKSPKLFGSVELNAPYLYGVDKFAENIQPDKEDIIIKWKKEKPKKEEKIKDISLIEPKVKEFNGVSFKKFKDLTTDKIIRKKSPLIGAVEIAEDATRKIDDNREYIFDILGIDEDRDVMIVRTIPTGKYEDIIDEETGEKRKVFRGQPDRIIIAPINQNRYLLQDLFDIGSLNKQTGFEFDNY
jgi:hypothetical protein